MKISGVGCALPPYYYTQDAILSTLGEYWADRLENPQFLARLHSRTGVDGRYFVMPLERYYDVQTWGQANDIWVEAAQDLGEKAIRCALKRAGLEVNDVGALFFVSVTGISSPSIDAKLMNRMKLPPHVK